MALLEATGVSRRFGGITAVNDVSLSIDEHSITCVIGPNGAGKSSLLDILSGSLASHSGDVRLFGEPILGYPANIFAQKGIVRKFQGANVFPWLTVSQNLEVARLANFHEGSGKEVDVARMLATVKLIPQANMPACDVSHGQRQWLEVGMVLMCRPRLLLLDEPTAGMTISGAMDMADLILTLSKEMAILVTEHNMHFVRRLDGRTVVMNQGAVIADGEFEVVSQDARVRNSYLGRA